MSDRKYKLKKLPAGPEIELTADLSVGRNQDSGLRLVEGSPSRRHAMLLVAADGVSVQDLGSTNGTFVNDQRIESKVLLKSNDRVRFDVEEYLFTIEQDPALADKTVHRLGPVEKIVESGRAKVPAGWIDNPQAAGVNKTQFMTSEEMEQQRQRVLARQAEMPVGPVDAPMLIVPGDPDGSMRFQLHAGDSDKKEWNVGSEEQREIRIKRAGVSGLHAKIVNEGKRWKVVDQLSANGTFVNGKRCMVSFLNSGDRISFGTVECIFQLPQGKGAGSSAKAGSGLKKILLIVGISFVITLIVLFLLLHRLGWF